TRGPWRRRRRSRLHCGGEGTEGLPPRPPRLRAHAETWSISSHGDAENAEVVRRGGLVWVSGAAETSRRIQGFCAVVVRSGRVSVRGVEPASPGRLRGGMSQDPTGGNHTNS